MILVDMEMPKSCRFCHLQDVCVPFQREVVTEVVSIDTLNERHKDCPIKAEIPDNATNGDVIKTMFPDLIMPLSKSSNIVHTRFGDKVQDFDKKWWNAPYKEES